MSEKTSGNAGEDMPDQVTGYFVQLPDQSAGRPIDIRRILKKLIRARILIVVILAVVTAAAFAISLAMTPTYRAEILLAPASIQDNQSQLAALLGPFAPTGQIAGLSSDSQSKDQAIAILQSRKFTEEFIESENLLPVLFEDLWDSESQEWMVDEPAGMPKMSDAVSIFSDSIRTVREDSRRNLVTLQIDWTDPVLAAQWANRLIKRLNTHLRDRDIAEAQRSIEFLNLELEKSGVLELRQGVYRLIESQIEMVMLANVREEYAFKILDPAVPPEPDNFVRPKRLLIVMVGFMFGLLLAATVALVKASDEK